MHEKQLGAYTYAEVTNDGLLHLTHRGAGHAVINSVYLNSAAIANLLDYLNNNRMMLGVDQHRIVKEPQ